MSVLKVANAALAVMVFERLGFQMISAGYPVESFKAQVHVPSEAVLHGFAECVESISQSASWV